MKVTSPEKYSNNTLSDITLPLIAGGTTIKVANPVPYPTTGNFRIRIDNEILLVTYVSGDIFTVTRAMEGTADVSHASHTPIFLPVTAASLEQLTNRPMFNYIFDTTADRDGTTGFLDDEVNFLALVKEGPYICYIDSISSGVATWIDIP